MTELLELLKIFKNKKIIVVFSIMFLGYFLISNIASMSSSEIKILLEILKMIRNEWLSLLFISLVIFLALFVLKHVHNKAEIENRENVRNQDYEYKIEIPEKFEILIAITNVRPYIDVKNTSNKDLDYARGHVSLYEDKVRIERINFEFNNLASSYGERKFLKDKLNHEKYAFDSADVTIEEMSFEGKVEKNLSQKGPSMFYTLNHILNAKEFEDFKIFGLRTKWNLAWLKKFLRRDLVPKLRYLFVKKSYEKESIKNKVSSFLFRLILFIVIAGGGALFILFVVISIFSIVEVVYEILLLVIKLLK